jgi:AmmeMemoRadiSam system protein B
VLPLLDGTRDSREVTFSLAFRFGLDIPQSSVDELVTALDGAFLLENAHSEDAAGAALAAYRRAAFRKPALAGGSYPEEPAELNGYLQGFVDQVGSELPALSDKPKAARGLVSPHIDYARGGEVYARIWRLSEESVRAAELVIILGTDHYAGDPTLTLTRQNYATPFGILPTDQKAVELLAAELGEDRVFADELHHRQEHSIELAAVWLHFIREGNPCSVLPILCGSFNGFIQTGTDPASDSSLSQGIQQISDYCAGKQTLIVAAGDLAHVGPAFGGQPLDLSLRAQIGKADNLLLDRVCAGDAAGFYQAINKVADQYNVCGLAPIYLALRLLAPAAGRMVSYEICPADETGTSVVTVCGVALGDKPESG